MSTDINVKDVIHVIGKEKKGKCDGPNVSFMEAFIYGGLRLWTHLSVLYTFCFRRYLPARMMEIEFIPLVKDKTGDIMDANNYRGITLSNVQTKMFETLILDEIKDEDYQFGFKKGHSLYRFVYSC